MNWRSTLYLTIAGIGSIALIKALIRIPLFIFDDRTILFMVIGVTPIIFLNNSNRFSYFVFSALMSGFGGLLLIIGNYIQCLMAKNQCINQPQVAHQPTALFCYGIISLFSIWWILAHKQRKKSKKE